MNFKFLSKLFTYYKDVVYVSRLTGIRQKKFRVLISIILLNIAVGLDILIIISFASFFQDVDVNSNFLFIFLENKLFLLPIFIVIRFLSNYLQQLNITKLQIDIDKGLKAYMLREVFTKGNISRADALFYVERVGLNVANVYGNLAKITVTVLQVIYYILYLFFTNLSILGIFGLGSIFILIPTRYFVIRGRKYQHTNFVTQKTYNNHINNVLDNLFLIKLVKKIDFEVNQFKKILDKYGEANINNVKVGILNTSIPTSSTYLILSFLLLFFGLASKVTLDFIGIMLRAFQELSNFNSTLMLVANQHVVFNELFKVITDNEESQYSENFINSKQLDSQFSVTFEDVNFQYFKSEVPIFENLNFKVEKNKHTIITGPNGSGKSTLLGLSAGILFAQEGKVTVNTNSFGYVGVNPLIVSGNIRENLMYGNNSKVDDETMLNYLYDFNVFNEEENYNLEKLISRDSLSSGQLQKISFIRSLLSNVEFLLLDESTSNLDLASKKLIFNILKKSNVTILNATHNPFDFDYDSHLKIEIENGKRVVNTIK